MSTRAAIRPRPLDINKQLLIVKDVSELDEQAQGPENGSQQADGHGHGHGGHGHGNQKKLLKAIPIPDIREVETHYRDYLPLFSAPVTYLHGKGCGGNREPDPVEYDLDNEDEDWLKTYNIGRSRLNDLLFEKMLHKLEVACAEATDTALSAAGAGPAERTAASAVAAIDHLPRHDAIRILMFECGGREKVCQDVYNYWAAKRKKWGKPVMRRLQAPTPSSDTNPYNTFRVRDKVNRPQTRRRRDNSDELMEKMRQLKDNLQGAKQILEEVVRRERRKRDLACTEIELLRIQYRTRHEVKLSHEQISTEGLNNLRERIRVNGQQDQIRAGARMLGNRTIPQNVNPAKRIRTELVLKCMRPAVATMANPPPIVEPEALWSAPANLLQIPLESKEKQRDRMDAFRRGKPAGFAPTVVAGQQDGAVAAAANNPGGTAAVGAASGQPPPPAADGQSGAEAQQQQQADGNAAAPATGGTAAAAAGNPAAAATGGAAPAAAAAGNPPAAPAASAATPSGLPPPGPSAPGSAPGMGGRMSAVMAALNERQHLFKLPDGLAGSITNWRCFIGRGGRARLERVDHVTHESIAIMKQQHMVVQKHYQTEPWPPMPTAPLLREIVEKSRPQQRPGVHRSSSIGLTSQPSSASAMMAAGPAAAAAMRRSSSANLGPAVGAAAGAVPAPAAAAAGAAANGPMPPVPSMQPVASVQMPQQQHVQQQAQQAHTMPPHYQQQQQQQAGIQQGMQGADQHAVMQQGAMQQQQQPGMMAAVAHQQQPQQPGMQQQQQPGMMAAVAHQQQPQQPGMMQSNPAGMCMQPQQMQQQDPALAAQQQQQYAAMMQQQQQMGQQQQMMMQQQQQGMPGMQQGGMMYQAPGVSGAMQGVAGGSAGGVVNPAVMTAPGGAGPGQYGQYGTMSGHHQQQLGQQEFGALPSGQDMAAATRDLPDVFLMGAADSGLELHTAVGQSDNISEAGSNRHGVTGV